MSQHMLFAGARLHTARVGCAVSVAVLSQHAARVESRRVCVFFVVWCLVYQYTIYAYGVYVCMCVSGAAHSASAPKTRNGQNQRATGKKPERAQHAHRAPTATLGGVRDGPLRPTGRCVQSWVAHHGVRGGAPEEIFAYTTIFRAKNACSENVKHLVQKLSSRDLHESGHTA